MPFKNKEEQLRWSKEYYQTNRAKILAEKAIIRSNPEYQEKMKRYLKEYYLENKEEQRPNRKVLKARAIVRNKAYVQEHLKDHPCIDCGNSNPIVAEFDHVRGIKARDVCFLVSQPASLERLQSEINKCEVRCANCHRIVTVERRNITQSERKRTDQITGFPDKCRED